MHHHINNNGGFTIYILEKAKKDTYYYVLRKINEYFRSLAEKSHYDLLGNDSYQYFQAPLDFFERALNVISERESDFKGKRFLELGSGIGCLCGIATFLGLNAEGIELNPILYEISKQIFPEVRFHNINVLDFNNYEDYDIVYYWLPFSEPNLQQILKKKIEDSISIGSYIIMTEEESQNAGKDDRFIDIKYISNFNGFDNKVWQKIK